MLFLIAALIRVNLKVSKHFRQSKYWRILNKNAENIQKYKSKKYVQNHLRAQNIGA